MTPLPWSPPAILISALGGTLANGHEHEWHAASVRVSVWRPGYCPCVIACTLGVLSMHSMLYMHSPGDGPCVPHAPDLINLMLHRIHDITHESLPRTPPFSHDAGFPFSLFPKP